MPRASFAILARSGPVRPRVVARQSAPAGGIRPPAGAPDPHRPARRDCARGDSLRARRERAHPRRRDRRCRRSAVAQHLRGRWQHALGARRPTRRACVPRHDGRKRDPRHPGRRPRDQRPDRPRRHQPAAAARAGAALTPGTVAGSPRSPPATTAKCRSAGRRESGVAARGQRR